MLYGRPADPPPSFPTVKVWNGRPSAKPRDYQGQRTARALADYATDNMPSYLKVRLASSTSS